MNAGKSLLRNFLVLLAVLSLAGCAGERAFRQGIELTDKGQIEEGLEKLEEAIKDAPNNLQFRMALINRRINSINSMLQTADASLNEDRLDDAKAQYARVLKLEKDNARALGGLNKVTQARMHAELMVDARAKFDAGDLPAAMEKIRSVLLENPSQRDALLLLKKIEGKLARNKFTPPALRKYTNPISLEFRDAPVKMVFDVLANTTGINFILDKDLRPEQHISIFAKNMTLDRAFNLLLDSNQLDKKIINENTVVIYPRTPQKSKEYDELMVRTFYLANADPKQTAIMLRTILKIKDVFVDDRLNMMVIRDIPEIILQAEKLISAQDLPEPEVLLEVTVMEVKRDRLLDLGVQPPTQFGVVNPVATSPLTLSTLRNLNSANVTVSPSPSVNINEQFSDVNVLANPRIRVRNREKAKINVGDRVPVITSTTSSSTPPVTTETVQYIDTGIKLEVEPNIYLEGDVSIKVSLEVNSLGTQTTTLRGSVVYQTGTRTATTLLRLKDGETQLLAGLINDEDRSSINGLPGLAALPLIGRLFGSHQDSRQKTEVVLSITPHIVRNIPLPGAVVTQFWSGTEQGGQGAYTESFIPESGMMENAVPEIPGAIPVRPMAPPLPLIPAAPPMPPPMPPGSALREDGSIILPTPIPAGSGVGEIGSMPDTPSQ